MEFSWEILFFKDKKFSDYDNSKVHKIGPDVKQHPRLCLGFIATGRTWSTDNVDLTMDH